MWSAPRTRPGRWVALALACLTLAACGLAPSAAAQESPLVPGETYASSGEVRPPGFRLSAGDAVRLAERVPEVRRERSEGGGLDREIAIPGYTGDPHRWQVTYSRDDVGVVEVHVDGRSGEVLEVWTGARVDFLLARPRDHKLAGALNSAWIWIPLCVLFVAPFFDPRRPFRLLHLDLLVLLSFGVAQLLFNEGRLEVWVPAVYPVLGYLLVRLLLAGFRPRERTEPLIPFARESWLLVGLAALLIARIVLNVVDSSVMDVSYASVIGADRIVAGEELYTDNDVHGDTYGPLAYIAYIPFELIFPWREPGGSLAAAHAAAITFDLLIVLGLVLLGRGLRAGAEGRRLGLALGFAWAALPYSTYVLQCNTNDGLLAMLLVYAMVAVKSPAGRGAVLGLGAIAKFVPAALAPLFATGTGERRPLALIRFWVAFAAACLVAFVAFLPDGGVRELWNTTLGYQLGRRSPFSLWGLHPSLGWLQDLVKVGAIGLCVALAFVPRRRDARQVAALAAAALIALQLGSTYWFFFYVSWFAPLALVAMFAAYRDPAPAPGAPPKHGARRRFAGPPSPGRRGPAPAHEGMEREGQSVPTATLPRRTGTPSQLAVVALFSATLVVSAGLVFMVQPMFARFVLPALGGTPAVWNTAMLFFQTALLLAYVYAHWTTRRFGPRRQAALHLAVVAAALLILPIGVPDGWAPPETGSPVLWLLLVLVVAVGLPFFVVSSTAPLLQSWLADTDHPDGRDPYFLYRASNIGSVAGLLSYPLLVEPNLTLDDQSWLWSAGYGALVLLLTACALVLWRSGRAPASAAQAADDAPAEPISWSRRVRWIGLAAVPSSLMLGVSTTMTTNVAPVPLLWVLPLSLYLVSFILVFSRGEGAGPFHRLALWAAPPLIVVAAGVTTIGITDPLWIIVGINLVAFFAIAVALHGELACDRPAASQLTQFYAFVSIGGALGGSFNVLVAPNVFNSLTEYPIALALAAFLLPMWRGSWTDELSFRRHLLAPLLVGGLGFVAILLTEGDKWPHRIAFIAVGLACLLLVRNSLRFGLALALAMVAVWVPTLDDAKVIHQDRSFFGVHRVESKIDGIIHEFKHGEIVHGAQIGAVGITPITYYHPTGPVGQLFQALPDQSLRRHTGVVGLGVGSMACYGRPGDRYTFFEIDSAVVEIARDKRLFSFLRDCKGEVEIAMGDGRRSLERRPDGEFGVLALDAFSADAIPMHLITREAVELYLQKLRPTGVIAFHLSNRYLDLEPQVGRIARATGLTCYAQSDAHVSPKTLGKFPSQWAALARSPAHLGSITRDKRWQPCRVADSTEWRDDYQNLLAALRWG
jgi:Glycosyltransferase family 87